MLHLTPEILESCYELLRTTPPFRGWKLPHADDVKFVVSRNRDTCAHCEPGTNFTLTVSQHLHSQLCTLLVTLAHEMIHIHEYMIGVRGDIQHGADFKRLAKQVCRYHGFDSKAF